LSKKKRPIAEGRLLGTHCAADGRLSLSEEVEHSSQKGGKTRTNQKANGAYTGRISPCEKKEIRERGGGKKPAWGEERKKEVRTVAMLRKKKHPR